MKIYCKYVLYLAVSSLIIKNIKPKMLIFLDIDGVLVPEKKFDKVVNHEDLLKFDAVCLSEFENILRRYPDVHVVISSSWREVFPFEAVRCLFSPDIAPRVLGFTPFLDAKIVHDFEYLRYQEVLEYLRQKNQLDTLWIAIDDIAEHYPPDIQIVVTDAYIGFDRRAALTLEKQIILTKQRSCKRL
jgi:hypothetical protein